MRTPTRRATPSGARRARPPAKKNPLPLILGGVGGALLLIVAIAVAASGTTRRKPTPPPKEETPVETTEEISVQNTGPIMFVCSDAPTHEDQEVLVTKCSGCGQQSTFWQDNKNGGFVCYGCRQRYDDALIKCPDCGKTPHRVRIKIR